MSKKADEAMQRDARDVAKKLLRQETRNGDPRNAKTTHPGNHFISDAAFAGKAHARLGEVDDQAPVADRG